MKSIARFLCALAAALAVTIGVTSGQGSEAPVRILPLGDSLTSGLSTNSVPGAYRNRLHTLLSGAGYNVDFVGTFTDSGNPGLPDTNHQGLGSARIDQIQSNLSAWLNASDDPDVVLLLIGTNDFWQNYQLSGVQTRLSNLISDIAVRRPFAKIIVSGLPLRTDSSAIQGQQSAFSSAIPGIVAQQVALGRQVSYLDLSNTLSPSDLTIDGVHPNAAGYGKIGDAWFTAVAGVISPKGTSNPPVLARVGDVTSPTQIPVVFSKPVSDASASASNFTISGGVTISGASIDPSKRVITLTTSAVTPGVVYTLTASNVRDRTVAQNPIAPGSMVSFSMTAIDNGSFENNYAGWTTTGNQEIKNSSPYTATNGTRIAAFNTGQNPPNGTLSRTFSTTVGQIYQLSFDYGAFGYTGSEQRIRTVVQGNTSLVNDTASVFGIGGGGTRWLPRAYTFTANSATTSVTFTDLSPTSDSIDLVLDNVRIAPVTGRTLAVTSTPTSGAPMTLSPADMFNAGSGNTGLIRQFADGATVTITAPTTHAGVNFLKWQRNGVDVPGSVPSITMTMNSDQALNAFYGSNLAPVAAADAYSTAAGTPLTIPAGGVLTNDTDPDGGSLSALVNAPPINGSLSLAANGGFTYTPAGGFTGTDSFTYRASDGVSDSNVVTVSITVGSGASANLIQNGSFESNLTSWTNSGNMLIQSASPYAPTNGTRLLAFNAAQLTPNGVLSQSFPTVSGRTYQLAFDAGVLAYNTSAQRMQVTVDGSSNLLTRTIDITGIGGGATRWLPQSFTFTANSSNTTLSFRDQSTTSNGLDLVLDNVRVIGSTTNHAVTVASMPTSGLLIAVSPPDQASLAGAATSFTRSYAEGTIINLSAPPLSGATAFVKWQRDGNDLASTRNVSVTIDAPMTLTAIYGNNAAPIATNDSYSTAVNTPLVIPAPGVLGNDTDADLNPITSSIVAAASRGSVVLNTDGGFTYTPETDYTGPVTFTYRANDGSSNSNTATVEINVLPVSPGTITNGSFELGEAGWTMSGNRLVIDTQTPYVPTDGSKLMVFNGAQSTPNAVISQTFTTIQGQAYVLNLDAGVIGAAGSQQRLQVGITGNSTLVSSLETLTGTGIGAANWSARSYAFVANSNSTTLTLSDLSTTSDTVDLLIDNVRLATGNARTLVVNSSTSSGVGITASPADINANGDGTTSFTRYYNDGTSVTLTAPANAGGGSFLKWQKNGSDLSTNPALTLTIDANTTLTAVFAENTAPSANTDTYNAEIDSALNVAAPGVLGNDTDTESQPLTATLVTGPTNGTVTLNSDGGFTYTPNTGYTGPDSFTYRANDGFTNSANGTVNLTVNNIAQGTLVNGSFEDGSNGWTITGNHFIVDESAPYLATDGSKLVVSNGGNQSPNAVFSQSFATSVGKTYVVTLDTGAIGSAGLQQNLLVSITGNSSRLSQQETLTATGFGAAAWSTKTYTFVADSTTSTLSLTDQSTATDLVDLLIDNVAVALRLQRTLTIESNPDSGLAISASPNDLNGNGNGSTGFTRVYNNNTTVTLTAPANAGVADFIKWRRNGSDFSGNRSVDVTMNADYTLTAVYGVNSAPIASGNSYSTLANTTLTINAPGVLANDSDPESTPLSALVESTTTSGTLTLNSNGGFSYTPNTGFTGTDSFTYRASDGALQSAPATVQITVEAPAAASLVNGSFEDGTTGWTISGNHFVIDSTAPYNATDEAKLLVLNGGQLAPNAVLSQNIATTPGTTYLLQFDMGVVGDSGTVQRLGVNVSGTGSLISQTESITAAGMSTVNWTPESFTFVANSTSSTISLSDLSTTSFNVDLLLDNIRVIPQGTRTLKVTSPVGTGLAVTASPVDRNGKAGGSTVFHRFHNNGTVVTLTAPATAGGSNFLRWRRNGVDQASTATTTVTMDEDVTMTAVYAAAPQILVNGSFENGYTGWTQSGNQIVSSGLTPTEGTKAVEFNGGQLTPNGVLSQSFATVPGLTYQLAFDAGTFALNTLTQTLQVSVDGNTNLLSRTVSVQGIGGGLTSWVPQSFSFIANSSTTTLTFRDVSSSGNLIDLLLDNVRVNGGPTIPRTLTVTSSPDSGLSVGVSPSDLNSAAAGTTLFTRSYTQGSVVTLTAPLSSGSLRFSKWTRNGSDFATTPAASVTVDADITLDAVYIANTAPVALADNHTTTVGNPVTIAAPGVLGNDTDAESNPLTAIVVTNPSNGTVTLNANGGFTYTPSATFQGTDTFTYKANDGVADSNIETVTIQVNAPSAGPFVNGSFEDGFTGWTVTGNTEVQSGSPYAPTNGTKLAGFNGGNTTPNGTLSQTFGTVAGTNYTLTFDAGALAFNTSTQRIQVTVNGSSSLLNQTISITGLGNGNTRWLSQSFNFTADSATTTLTFTDVSTTTNLLDLLLDKVAISGGPVTTNTLTVASSPATGASITVSPADNAGNSSGTAQFTRTYNTGSVVNLTAPATFGGNVFQKWQRNGVDAATTAATTVTLDADVTMTAVYAPGAGPSLLVNGSFESGFTGWLTAGNVEIQSSSPFTATDGTNIAGFNGANSTPNGVVSQSFATTPGASYTLAFDAGALSFTTAPQSMNVSVTGTGSLLSQVVTVTRTGGSNNLWVPQSFTFVANSATSTVSFTDVSTSTAGLDLTLDNVRVSLNAGAPILQTLTVNSTPVSAAIGVSPNDSNGSGNGTASFGRAYATDTVVTLTAPSTSGGGSFQKWQMNGVDLTTNNVAVITMNASYTLTAVYSNPGFSNGSFETGTFAPWTTSGGTVDSVKINSLIGGTQGSKIVEFNSAQSPAGGVLTQTFATTPGVTYNLAFDLGVIAFNTNQQRVLVTVNGSSQLLSQTATINGNNLGTPKWEAKSYSFTANSTSTTLTFTDTSTVTNAIDMLLDNVRVTNANARSVTIDTVVAGAIAATLSPADNNGAADGTTRLTREYNVGTTLNLSVPATAANGATFVKWVKDGADHSTNRSTTVSITADTNLVAVYTGGTFAPLGTNLIQNHSFELLPDFVSWATTGATRIEKPQASSGFPTDGNHILSFNVGGGANDGVVTQQFATTIGTTYTLQLDVGVYGGPTGAAIDQTLSIQAIGNGIPLSRTVTVRGSTSSFVWSAQTFTFTADSTSTTLRLADASSTGAGTDLFVDNVRVRSGMLPPSTLTVASTPAAGKVITVNTPDLAGQGNGTTDFSRIYNTGANVAMVAPFQNFVKWLKNGQWYATNPSINVLVDGNHTMTAVYTDTPVPGPFTNGSFEGEFAGWTWSGSQQSVKVKDGLPTTDGIYIIEFNSNSSATDGSLSQTFVTTPGTVYNVTFDIGTKAFNTSTQTLRARATGSSGSIATQTYSIAGIGGGQVVYAPRTFTFTANSATTTLTFSDESATGDGLDLLLDNVKVNGSGGSTGGSSGGSSPTLTIDSISATAVPITVSAADKSGSTNGNTRMTRSYDSGTSVTLAAPATAPNGATFVKWVQDGTDLTTNTSATVTVTANSSLFAIYTGGTFAPLGSNLIQNGSFEFFPDFVSWGTTGATRIEKPQASSGFPTDGNHILSFNVGGGANDGVVTQQFATTVGTTYTLQLDVGVYGGTSGAAIDQTLDVRAIGVGIPLSRTVTVRGSTSSFVWTSQTFTFTADSATTTLRLADASSTGAGTDLFVDNVRVRSGTLPPSTLAITSTPLAGKAITVNTPDLAGQGSGTTNFSRIYNTGANVAMVAPHQNFVKWLKNGQWYATNPTINVLADGNHTMTAVYTDTPVLGPFTNGSFESEFTGWTWSGSQQSVKVKDGLPSTDGLYLIEFNSNSSANDGSITQTFTTTPGTSYALTFDMGTLGFNTSLQSLEASATGSGTLFTQTYSMNGTGNGTVNWSTRTINFTANSPTTTLTFRDRSATGAGIDLLLDNVRINGSTGSGVPRTLTVNSTPSNGAAITVTPVDNGSQGNGTSSFTRTYFNGTAATLTAPSTFGGNVFVKWQRNGVDAATTAATTVTMDADLTMTAVYAPASSVVAFVNGSFEQGLTGWTSAGSPNTVATDNSLTGTNGTTLVKFNSANSGNDGSISQTFPTTAGTTYTVNFDMGVLAYISTPQSLRATATGSGTLFSQVFTMTAPSNGNVTWTARTFSFTANSSSTTLSFADASSSTVALDLLIDNVRVTVPPSLMPAPAPAPEMQSEEGSTATLIGPPTVDEPPTTPDLPVISGTPGDLTIRMLATEAGRYILQSSDDLRSWTERAEQTITQPGIIEFGDSDAPSVQRFYRIGKQAADTGN